MKREIFIASTIEVSIDNIITSQVEERCYFGKDYNFIINSFKNLGDNTQYLLDGEKPLTLR